AFSARLDFNSATNDAVVRLTDLDGDGKPDLAIANLNGWISVLPNNTTTNGLVSFGSKTDYGIGSTSVSGLTIGDLDGDGKPDLIVSGVNLDNISILRNKSTPGNIAFDAISTLPVGHGPFSASIGDLDGDGKPDLVVADMYA